MIMGLADNSIAVFAPAASGAIGARIAAALGVALSPHEEEEFTGREYKLRTRGCIGGRSVYVVQSLFGDSYWRRPMTGSASCCFSSMRSRMAVRAVSPPACPIWPMRAKTAAARRMTRSRHATSPSYSKRSKSTEWWPSTYITSPLSRTPFAAQPCISRRPLSLPSILPRVPPGAEYAVVSPDIGGVKRAHRVRDLLEAATRRHRHFRAHGQGTKRRRRQRQPVCRRRGRTTRYRGR